MSGSFLSTRPARACPGHPRLSFFEALQEDVDGRDKPGHDEEDLKFRSPG
jgi:hypothetical protein